MQKEHPDVDLYIGALDEKLNDHGYIVPGPGRCGETVSSVQNNKGDGDYVGKEDGLFIVG